MAQPKTLGEIMFFVLSNSSKPCSEFGFEDVGFRKINNATGAIFVYKEKTEADHAADELANRGIRIGARRVTKEELALVQARLSTGTVKFVFERSGADAVTHHETVGTL